MKRLAERLRRVGLKVLTDAEELSTERTHAVLALAELSSLEASANGFYPWLFNLEVADTTQFTDGSKGSVLIWSFTTYGYGGSEVVIDQVTGNIDRITDKLALDVLAARPQH